MSHRLETLWRGGSSLMGMTSSSRVASQDTNGWNLPRPFSNVCAVFQQITQIQGPRRKVIKIGSGRFQVDTHLTCMHPCIHTYMFASIRTGWHAKMNTRKHGCIHKCMHTCIYTCTYVIIYSFWHARFQIIPMILHMLVHMCSMFLRIFVCVCVQNWCSPLQGPCPFPMTGLTGLSESEWIWVTA